MGTRKLGALAAAAACAVLAAAGSAQAGKAPGIVGGSEAPASSWPAVVFVYGTYDAGAHSYGCTGSVVAPEWVITAAHCAFGDPGKPPDTLEVVLGVKDYLDPTRTIVGVDRLVVHPAYDATRNTDDVALLHLVTPTALPPLRIATRTEFAAGAYNSIVDLPNAAGWGATDEASTQTTTVLHEAYLQIWPTANCKTAIQGFDSSSEVCAGAGKTGACHGDSGGPLLAFDAKTREPVLWGLTSYGPQVANHLPPCSLAMPVVFTWLPAVADFVQSTVGVMTNPAPVPTATPAPTPTPAPTGVVPPPPSTAPSAACTAALAKFATAKRADAAALKRLLAARKAARKPGLSRAARRRARQRESTLSHRYHLAHDHRLRLSAASGRACK
jgi:secreted trypsin-like serine protease